MAGIRGTTGVRNADTVAPTGAAGGAQNAGQIIDAWKSATFDAAISDLAHQNLKPKYQAAISEQAERLNRDLSDDEIQDFVGELDDKLLEPERQKVLAQIGTDPAAKKKLIDSSIADLRSFAPKLKNPFKAIALGDPAARAKENVLWEDKDLMVLVDRFSKSPKVLVVPKAPALTPLDVAPGVLDEVGKVAQVASNVFTQLTKAKPSDTWVNPPQFVTIGQVHLHVQPNLRPLRESMEDRFWASFESGLIKALGPATDVP